MLTTVVVLMVLGSGALAWQVSRRSQRRARELAAHARGPHEVRTHDVVSHGGRDFLVEGVVQLEDGAKRRRLARLVDGADVQWLYSDGQELALLRPAAAAPPPLPPPDVLVLGAGETFRLADVGGGRVARHGDVGSRAMERCRFWRYVGPGPRRAWLDEFRAPELLLGEVVLESMLDVLPGS